MDEFTLFTSHVANRLGVSKERVTELRKNLPEGEEWKRDGNRVLFKETVVSKMAELLKVPELPEEIKTPEVVGMVVAKVWPNPRYVGALQTQAPVRGYAIVPEGPMLTVRVRTSLNLTRGMVLPCVKVHGDLYEALELPRRKGRW
jgi:hypothetical protein